MHVYTAWVYRHVLGLYLPMHLGLRLSLCMPMFASNLHLPSHVTEQDPLSSWVPSTPALCPHTARALLSPNAGHVPNR